MFFWLSRFCGEDAIGLGVTDQPAAPPEWIYKRDGRLDPFDADRLCRSLFAATERLGRPDAFTARELTDGVLHFLADETENRIATTAQVAETVVKVVRELGHPAVAQAYAAGAGQKTKHAAPPRPIAGRALCRGRGHRPAGSRNAGPRRP